MGQIKPIKKRWLLGSLGFLGFMSVGGRFQGDYIQAV